MAQLINTDTVSLNVNGILQNALRVCGVKDGSVTPAFIKLAREQLLFTLMELSNRSTPLWAVEDTTLGFNLNQSAYELPASVYNIIDINWRQTQPMQYQPSGGIDPDYLNDLNYFTYATTTDFFLATVPQLNQIGYIGLFFYGTQSVTLTIEVSADMVTWQNVYLDTTPRKFSDGEWLWLDLQPQFTGYYVRVTCGLGEILSLRQLYISNLVSMIEMPMQRMNRDTYFTYVNKRVAGTPLSWYLDKQLKPVLYIWNQPTEIFNWQLRIKQKNIINSDLSLGAMLEVPIWYQEAIVWMTASKVIWMLPRDIVDVNSAVAIQAQADSKLKMAGTSESDGSPLFINTDASGYSR